MTVNRFFDHTNFAETQEHNLVQSIVDETIQIHGLNFFYIPRTQINTDYLFGEDRSSNFNSATLIEMYLETIDGWDASTDDVLSRFGLVTPDSVTLVCSRQRFREELTQQFSNITSPEVGDLIYYSTTDSLFEIKQVDKETPFYQLGKNYTFKLFIEKFSYSYETLNTGITEIDDVEDQFENIDSTENSYSDNNAVEAEADGSTDDGFDDTGSTDRGDGIIDFDESDPFLNY